MDHYGVAFAQRFRSTLVASYSKGFSIRTNKFESIAITVIITLHIVLFLDILCWSWKWTPRTRGVGVANIRPHRTDIDEARVFNLRHQYWQDQRHEFLLFFLGEEDIQVPCQVSTQMLRELILKRWKTFIFTRSLTFSTLHLFLRFKSKLTK